MIFANSKLNKIDKLKFLVSLIGIFVLTSYLFAQQKGIKPAGNGQQSIVNGQQSIVNNQKSIVNNTYAVVVGISDYQDPGIPDLRFADRDAEAFANYLRSPAGGSLDNDHLKLITNKGATGAQISIALDWLIEVANERDNVIIYFSGHGDVEAKRITQPGYLLGWDAPSRVYMSGGTVNVRDLQEIVTTLSVQNKARVILITDACHSGKLSGNEINGAQLTGQNLARQFANEIKILSCQPNEYSIEGEQWGGGRGAFSYNLVNGLYGMADANNDLTVNLKEIGRYLEDHVTEEVAPVKQNPKIIGDPIEHLAHIDQKLLADIRSGDASKIAMFSNIESRGIEEEVLSKLDTSILEMYYKFRKALEKKTLLEPANACAEIWYKQLMTEPGLSRLYSTMTRNYAAALQDEAQQVINIWLEADIAKVECIRKNINLNSIPRQLSRAAELLGEGHYMYRPLLARKLLFDGIVLMGGSTKANIKLGHELLSIFQKAQVMEPNSPLPWRKMAQLYAGKIFKPDSAFFCATQALNLAPKWVLVYADLCQMFNGKKETSLAKMALDSAEAIDAQNPYILIRKADWLRNLGGTSNLESSVSLYQKYIESGKELYSCLMISYANSLERLKRIAEAEQALKIATALDSTKSFAWNNLGNLYYGRERYVEAEAAYNKAVIVDSTSVKAWGNLGYLYYETQRYEEAEIAYRRAITLDSTYVKAWGNLGELYFDQKKLSKAEATLKKTIELDSLYYYDYYLLGLVYFKTNRLELARQSFLKAIELNTNFAPAILGVAYLLTADGKSEEALTQLEKAIQKGSTYEQLEKDEDLARLRLAPEWKTFIKKYFPQQSKD
ncbi:MAG: tetratricopeptide repeat protein [Saprospiraceae bacterium]|nr:tetratricopeptide repeat protein [Saprospiraceae bacterium]